MRRKAKSEEGRASQQPGGRPSGLVAFRSSLSTCLALLAFAACSTERPIVIGAKNFTESDLLGEIVAQQIERTTGLPVRRRLHLGGTFVAHEALTSGALDVYVEYTGTALVAILDEAPTTDADSALARVRRAYADRFAAEWLEPFGFDNTFAMLVRGADARRLGLRTLSEAVPHARRWTAGFGYEFQERADGWPGLARAYGLQLADPPRVMDLGLTYRALADGQVDLIAGNATDGQIAALDLFQLADDRAYFPAYQAVPVARAATLEAHPEVRRALTALRGTITDSTMRRLNHAVDVELRDLASVVREFLRTVPVGER